MRGEQSCRHVVCEPHPDPQPPSAAVDPRGSVAARLHYAHKCGHGPPPSTILGIIPNTPDPASDAQDLPPLHRIGTAALAVQVVGSNWPKPHYTLLITGLCRFQIVQVLKEKPYPVAEVEQLDRLEEFPNTCKTKEELGELSEQFYRYAVQLVEMLDMSVPAVAKLRRLLDSLPREALPDILTSIIRTSNKEKLQILDAVSLEDRFKMTIPLLVRQIEGLKLLQKTRKPKQDDDKRVIAIRPIRRITHIPGTLEDEDEEEDNDDIVMLEKKIKTSSMPEQAHKVCVKEIKRLKKMPQSMPEYALTRNYLELMVELPWNKSTTDRLDIRAARILLDNDHYAMEKLKRRVLEYLAVRQLKNNLKGPILCFVGPPGVGKTSVGRSVAKTLGREFHRIALGGVCDQSDIRGHRRTYVGSMPGRIINGLKTVGVNNPVFLLDEVDKLGKSLQGDPAAALLEEEKIEIAHRHLIPKQLEQHGLTPQQIQIPQLTTLAIITRYTREAGVRSLDRKFGAICRAVAVKVAEGQHKEAKLDRSDVADGEGCREHVLEDAKPEAISDTADLALPPEMPILIDFHALKDILGPPLYELEVSERLSQPGVAIGLAWTPLGGKIMFVEASRMDGEGQLTLTGQLGDVMKESAHLAISWLRSNAKKYHLTNGTWPSHGGNTAGKEGPEIMIQEVSYTSVTKVGGIKDKVLAAHRAGLKHIIIPQRNEKDLEEIPSNIRQDLSFVTASCLDEVLNAAFDGGFTVKTRPGLIDSKL
ncbi:Peroxisomal Lon protease-like 2 [Cricetulus griseus]|uniref:Peroxisomal Lon protease-like 2 n=1 Tax=Cricetulus griseus TaxID=10029 RepID=G3HYR0_CRIGR|nr:Peroxisomal Lon protease-like 2 [Cricetulus griseus]